MPRIFISYRREDSEHITGRIHDRLGPHFGSDNVFMDIDTIPFGVDFREHLDEAVSQCDVLLAVIGENWLDVRHRDGPLQGQRRLDDPSDFVRIEIQSALARGIPVIPVLVGRAGMPREQDLPEGLKDLAYRNAVEVRSGRDFNDQIERLIRGVDLAKRVELLPQAAKKPSSRSVGRWLVPAVVTLFVVVVVGLVVVMLKTGNRYDDPDRQSRKDTKLDTPQNGKPIEETTERPAPPDSQVTDVISARSLNDLVNRINSQHAKGLRGPDIRLSEDLLHHINLTTGTNSNVGLLRDSAKLNWPLPLQEPEFEELTRLINTDLQKARDDIDFKLPIDPGILKDLKVHLDRLNVALDNASARLTANDKIESKRYLNLLGDTFRALQDPDVANYFNSGRWTARGNTVAEFVSTLTGNQGLLIAPACPGDEPYYRALRAALTAYDVAITK
jgi:hypothetical protein